jgi:hypothetical protein
LILSNISCFISYFIDQDEEDSDVDVEEVVGEEEEEVEAEGDEEEEEDESKINRNWSVLKTTPQLRKSKVL